MLSLKICFILMYSFSVAPTALWIAKKEQHLLAGTAATYTCSSVGAYPQNRFIWYLGDKQLFVTHENKVS